MRKGGVQNMREAIQRAWVLHEGEGRENEGFMMCLQFPTWSTGWAVVLFPEV